MTGHLTRRQREVLLLAANGNTNRAIARWLGVKPHSVAEILTVTYRRLGASDRAQAVAVALAVGELGVHEIHIPDRQREAAWIRTAPVRSDQNRPEKGPERPSKPLAASRWTPRRTSPGAPARHTAPPIRQPRPKGPDMTDYDRDPEAIAWARTKIQPSIDKAERFSREADTEEARTKWRWIAHFMHRELIGPGEGCVITAFDERLPEHRARMDNAVPLANPAGASDA